MVLFFLITSKWISSCFKTRLLKGRWSLSSTWEDVWGCAHYSWRICRTLRNHEDKLWCRTIYATHDEPSTSQLEVFVLDTQHVKLCNAIGRTCVFWIGYDSTSTLRVCSATRIVQVSWTDRSYLALDHHPLDATNLCERQNELLLTSSCFSCF
jgi:hypothetical protein